MKHSTAREPKSLRNLLLRLAMGITIFLLLLVLLTPEITRRKVTVKEGDIVTHDLYAPLRFSVPNYDNTEKLRREAMLSVLPVYNFNRAVLEGRKKALENFFKQIETVNKPLSPEDEKRFKGDLNLSQETLNLLFGDVDLAKIKTEALRILNLVLSQGVISERADLPQGPKDSLSLREKDSSMESKKEVSSILVLKELNSLLTQEAEKVYPRNANLRISLVELIGAGAVANISPDKSETLRRKEEIARSVPLQYDWIEKDEVIIRKGERINANTLIKIKKLEETLAQGRRPLCIFGLGLLMAITIGLILLYLRMLEPSILNNLSNLAAIGLILIVTLMVARLTLIYNLSFYLVPVAAGGMLVTLLFAPGLGLIQALLLSLFTGFITNFNFLFLLLGLTSSAVGIYRVKGASHRSDIIKAGGVVGLTNALLILAWGQIHQSPLPQTFLDSFIGLGNGVICAFLVAGFLPFFEYFLKVTTNISLLELSDLNHPLLKDLALKAPGSFQSSIMMGTLAEAAASAVGANALLARVGAYFHDIGKIKKPAYFTENQMQTKNRHEGLSSTISGLVLISHVKEGLELARQYRLPDKIINIIHEHHGTTLVFYFYHRALEEKKGGEIAEEDFRYPGPKPQSKEAAIVMLADSVEAACRSLTEPSPGRIENLVKKIINNKFIDYQLDECELTLKDLNKISQSLIHHLTGIFHSRIQYPEEGRDAQDTHRKPSEDQAAKSS